MKLNKIQDLSFNVSETATGFCLSCLSFHSNEEKVEAPNAWVQYKHSVFPPIATSDRENKRQGFLNASLPLCLPLFHPLFPPPPLPSFPSPHSPADGECHIRCFLFAHQTRGHSCTAPKPAADVSAQLPDNQCRWNTFWGWKWKAQKQVLFSQKLHLAPLGEPLRSEKQNKDKFAKFLFRVLPPIAAGALTALKNTRQEGEGERGGV